MRSIRLHRSRPNRSPRRRCWKPEVDRLESRGLLSTAPPLAHPMYDLGPMAGGSNPPAGAYTPAQIEQAYQFDQIRFGGAEGTGAGETIAIVDAYNDPNIQSDLNTFDTAFGLPSTTVARVGETGGATSLPSTDSTGGWELEESLDVEWAHAMAPGANILLVEAKSANDSDLMTAVSYAAAHANVVSMSWGGGESPGESEYDGDFSEPGVVFVASSGDDGAPIEWPAASPNVLAVGGTALTLGSNNIWSSEVGWSGSGGGPSAYESQPAYQAGVVTATSKRADPDVAYDASPSTGFAVYDSNKYEGTIYDWLTVGGTSAGAPQWSALLAIADQGRALEDQPAIDAASPQEVMTTLYQNPGDLHDITGGTSDGTPHYSAGPGYDYVTGLGSPIANQVVAAFDGTTAAAPDTLVLTAPTSETAGASFSLTVTARNAGGTADTGFLGTIQFASSDVQAGLPSAYTFTAADAGSHAFTVTLKTAGSRSITATDPAAPSVTGTLSGITVSPAAAGRFLISGLSATATAGVSQAGTITAEDAYGNVATGYTGTIQFSSSDARAILPGAYTFQAADRGSHAFTITFETAGSQSLTVSSTASSIIATQSGISVAPAAPTDLTATVASASQINLSWIGATGATGYLIQRSPNGSSGWTTIATTSAGTTGYQDTGLSAGTTYSYRVAATVGNLDSAFSNTAGTTTTAVATVDTIWSNSYVPAENASGRGAYELGVKFESSAAGTVTGVRFYKEASMGGYAHVGHLWSATGTLLATATFTGETASGWQQVSFSSPVTIQANTVYIASFSSGGGYFGISTNFFTRGAVTSGPLTALANGTGGDGVYQTRNGAFPSQSGAGMNFWVDVDFVPSSGANTKSAYSMAAPAGAVGIASGIGVSPFALAASDSSSSLIGSDGSAVATAPGTGVSPASWSHRGPVAQGSTLRKGTWSSASFET